MSCNLKENVSCLQIIILIYFCSRSYLQLLYKIKATKIEILNLYLLCINNWRKFGWTFWKNLFPNIRKPDQSKGFFIDFLCHIIILGNSNQFFLLNTLEYVILYFCTIKYKKMLFPKFLEPYWVTDPVYLMIRFSWNSPSTKFIHSV